MQAQQRADSQTLNEFITQRATALEQELGITTEQAQSLAQHDGQLLWQQFNTERMAQALARNAEAKAELAHQLAEQYKVPFKDLMREQSPQAMRQKAESLTAQGKDSARIAALEAEVIRLKKATVPPAHYESGQGATRSSGGTAALKERYAGGGILTEQELASIGVKER